MAKAYSQDLRDRVIGAVAREGMKCREAGRRFGVSASTAIKWVERYRETGSRKPVGTGGHRPSVLKPHRDFLVAVRAEQPDITLEALSRRLAAERSVKADTSMLSRFFRREGITFKKKTLVAREQDRPDVSRRREQWRKYQGRIDPTRLVFPRRDLGQDQHDPHARLGAARSAAARKGPARPLEDSDLSGRAAPRRPPGALPVRWPDQWRAVPGLCPADARSHPQAG
jgi:transposase